MNLIDSIKFNKNKVIENIVNTLNKYNINHKIINNIMQKELNIIFSVDDRQYDITVNINYTKDNINNLLKKRNEFYEKLAKGFGEIFVNEDNIYINDFEDYLVYSLSNNL